MVHRHDRQILFGHLGNQSAPQSCAHHHGVGGDGAPVRLYPLNAAVGDMKTGCFRILKDLQPTTGFRLFH